MLVIVKAKSNKKGNLKLIVESDGLGNGVLEIPVIKNNSK